MASLPTSKLHLHCNRNVQPQYIMLVWHWWFTFQRNSGEWQECVYNTSRSQPGKSGDARAATSEAKFKLRWKSRWDLVTWRNAQVQTLGSRQSQHSMGWTLCSDRFLWDNVWLSCNKRRKSNELGFFHPVFGLAVCWPNKSPYTLLLINRITADGCVITLLLWWAWHGYPVGY